MLGFGSRKIVQILFVSILFLLQLSKLIKLYHRSPLTKLAQGQNQHIAINFLEANFECFMLFIVRDNKKIKTVPTLFF